MAQDGGKPKPDDRERETLDAFQGRFGRLSDRHDQAAYPGFAREELPTAEHPSVIEAREAQASADKPEHEIWPGKSAQPDFQDAANDRDQPNQDGVNSRQVGEDAPEHNLPAPRDGEQEDRAAHVQRMARDDTLARREMAPGYRERLEERLRQEAFDRAGDGQTRDRGQDYDHSR